MNWLNRGVTALFDLLLGPLQAHPAWAMLLVSVVTGIWALLLFKVATPQRRLARARDRLLGHIYEMGMYQDHLRVLGRIQRDLAAANLRYLGLTLPALLVLGLPMVLTLAQLEGRFAHRPLRAGESAVVTVGLARASAADLGAVRLELPPEVEMEAGPVFDRAAGAAAWRVRPLTPGRHRLTVAVGDRQSAGIDLDVGGGLPLLGRTREQGWLGALLAPGAEPLAGDGVVRRIAVQMPPRVVSYLGVRLNWLVAFMVLSLAGGLALKDVLKVSI